MHNWKKSKVREALFRIGVWLKGIDGALQIAIGIALFFIGPSFILRALTILTQDELVEDPHNIIASYALNSARHLSLGAEHFVAYYLLAHGILKALLVWGLLKDILWTYPISIVGSVLI